MKLSEVDEDDDDFSATNKGNVYETHNININSNNIINNINNVFSFHLNVVYIYVITYSVFIKNRYYNYINASNKTRNGTSCWIKEAFQTNIFRTKCMENNLTGFLSFLSLLVVNFIFRFTQKVPKHSTWIFLVAYLNIYSTCKQKL